MRECQILNRVLPYNLTMLQRVCVFCGSSPGTNGVYREVAQEIGRLLCQRGIELVYGGGNVGLMGAVADACLQDGGRVIGVIPEALKKKELAHGGLTELRVVGSMHERKALMADLSDAFIALPGGYGTWDEFCEVFDLVSTRNTAQSLRCAQRQRLLRSIDCNGRPSGFGGLSAGRSSRLADC